MKRANKNILFYFIKFIIVFFFVVVNDKISLKDEAS